MHTEERYHREDGQPKVPAFDPHQGDRRVALDVRLSEPNGPMMGSAARCPGGTNGECGRVAFRNVGDYPWVNCVCGHSFNVNYSVIGATPWPEPPGGQPFVVHVLGEEPDYDEQRRINNRRKRDDLDSAIYLLGDYIEGAEAAADTAAEHAEVEAMHTTLKLLQRQRDGLDV